MRVVQKDLLFKHSFLGETSHSKTVSQPKQWIKTKEWKFRAMPSSRILNLTLWNTILFCQTMNKLWLNKKGFNQYRFKIVFFVWDITKIEWLSEFFNVNFHPRINSTSWLKLSILQTLSNYLFNRSKIIFG